MEPAEFPAHPEFPTHTRPVGEVTVPASAVAAARPLFDWLGDLDPDRPQALAEYSGRLARTVRDLVEAGVDGHAATRMISDFNDTLLTTLLRLAEARLGQPPCPYAWLVLGSAGRREQALLSDQDNAIVFGDPEDPEGVEDPERPAVAAVAGDAGENDENDETGNAGHGRYPRHGRYTGHSRFAWHGRHAGHDSRPVPDHQDRYGHYDRRVVSYFTALAEAAEAGLETAGFARCQGGCTATKWQHSLADWRRIFRDWVEWPEPRALVQAEVFLDFRRVHGTLSPEPLDDVLRSGAGHPRFLVQMARAAVTFVPPLGLFRRVRATDGHAVDLKRAGIAAIVLLARLYALAAGSVVRPTPERLAAAVAGGMLSPAGGDHLAEQYRFLTDLRLRSQVHQVSVGGRPDNRLEMADLSGDDRRRLREALRAVREVQQATAVRFQTDAVT